MASNEFKARAVFDFVAESSSELSFNAEDILIIISVSDESQWWSAQNSLGQTGLIPANYVKIINDEVEELAALQNPQTAYTTTDDNGPYFQPIQQANYLMQEEEQEENAYSNDAPNNDQIGLPQQQTNDEPLYLNEQEIFPDTSFDSSPAVSIKYDSSLSFTPNTSTFNDQYSTAMDSTLPQDPFSSSIPNNWQQNNTSFNEQEPWYINSNTSLAPTYSAQNDSSLAYSYNQTTTTEKKQEQVSSLDNQPFSSAPSTVQTSSNDFYYLAPTNIHSSQPQTMEMQPTSNAPSMLTVDPNVNNNAASKVLSSAKSEEMIASSTSKASLKEKFFTLGRKKAKSELDKKTSMNGENLEQSSTGAMAETKTSNSLASSSTTIQRNANANKINPSEGDIKAATAAKARFFDKHGVDNYLLHGSKSIPEEHVQINYDEKDGGVQWSYNPTMPPFTCRIEEPSKASKLAGTKSFMEYKIHTTISGDRVVARRYKHFDWFHTQLISKFRFICIPQLPGKQITGRFEQEFVAERRRQLEIWLNRICRHPVLCASFAVQHFLTCERTESNDREWKAGKRRIEKDELKEATWLNCVSFLNSNISDAEIQLYIDAFAQYQPNLEIQIRNLNQGLVKYLERHTEIYEREIQRVGDIFAKFQKVLTTDTTTLGNVELSDSTLKVSNAYNSIAELYKTKGVEGLRDFNERTQEYIGIIGCFPMIFSLQKSSSEFIRSLQQRPPPDYNTILSRSQVLNHVVLAEINFFQKEKVKDLNLYLKTLMNEQIQFYEKVKAELSDAALTFH